MRTVVHLSDLHFGRVDLSVVKPLLSAIEEASPHLVVVSGDFVQNGTRREFELAREFIKRLPTPWIAVPGNHDLPFANIWQRVSLQLRRYQEYITTDLEPFYIDPEIAVMGVNTARIFPMRGGRINEEQIKRIEQQLCTVDHPIVKILVTHHPFDLAPSYPQRDLVGRARLAIGRLGEQIDVLLAGHMHIGHSGHTAERYFLKGRSAVFVQAGTATSTRGRGQPNSFNILRIAQASLSVERYQWKSNESRFQCAVADRFTLHPAPAFCPA